MAYRYAQTTHNKHYIDYTDTTGGPQTIGFLHNEAIYRVNDSGQVIACQNHSQCDTLKGIITHRQYLPFTNGI